jgi:hypothetical protein
MTRFILFFTSLFSFLGSDKSKLKNLPEITPKIEADGFVHLTFKIVDFNEKENDYEFKILAKHENKLAGMKVFMVKNISGGFDNEMNLIQKHVYYRGIKFPELGKKVTIYFSYFQNYMDLIIK